MTGMSGTGKSSALERLRRLGFRTVDTDEGDWTEWSEAEGGYVWSEEWMAERRPGGGTSCSATWQRSSRFYVGRALTKSTLLSR